MAKYRRGRVNEAVTNEVSQIVREIKDPRLAGVMITVTGADVTPDLKFAKIFYSVIGEHEPKETAKALRSAATFVRSALARRLNMRNTPEISFVFDESVERGAHLNEIFRSIEAESAKRRVSADAAEGVPSEAGDETEVKAAANATDEGDTEAEGEGASENASGADAVSAGDTSSENGGE